MWQISILYSIYFHVKYTNLIKFNMCKLFTSFFLFSVLLFLSSLLIFHFLSPYQSEHYTKRLQVFDLILLIPHVWFRAVDASEFMNFSREKKTHQKLRAFFISSMLKGFCNMTWEYIQVSQHVFDKEDIWTFAIYCTVHGTFLFTFKIQFTGKP